MTEFAEVSARPVQLLVLDPRQPGWPAALAAAGADTAVLLLDAGHDGLQQIAEVAKEYAPLKTIHLPEHGTPGQALLGRTVLDAAHLAETSWLLARIGEALAPEGVLRLGGEPGRGVLGRRLADLVAEAAGRAVLTVRQAPLRALTAVTPWSHSGTPGFPAMASV
ncbi:DUF4347 domain-containing protein [Teichococcus coralli]|nr:DUF4347 domain-containing protein [Pseudoroseomonas coralli]